MFVFVKLSATPTMQSVFCRFLQEFERILSKNNINLSQCRSFPFLCINVLLLWRVGIVSSIYIVPSAILRSLCHFYLPSIWSRLSRKNLAFGLDPIYISLKKIALNSTNFQIYWDLVRWLE